MNPLTIVGIILLILGLVTFIFGGFPVSSKTESIDIGPLEATLKQEKHYPVPTAFSLAAIGAGLTLIVLGGRR